MDFDYGSNNVRSLSSKVTHSSKRVRHYSRKYPGGIVADWAPTIGPQTVLNTTNQKTWKPLGVAWIGTDLYNRQHLWFDVDGDGIMCETDQSAPRKK